MDRDRLRIVVIAPVRYPIAQPHAGGLESSIWNHINHLKALGHIVTLCAVAGSDFIEDGPPIFTLPAVTWPDPTLATDITYPPGYLVRVRTAMNEALRWISERAEQFDIIENHCLHGWPLEWTGRIGLPMVTNLHTPALPDLVNAHRVAGEPRSSFVAVSSHTADEWAVHDINSTVVQNAVDPDLWMLGPGGNDLVWFGRIVPEKAPHLAIQAAARAGLRILLAGRIGDEQYAADHFWPLLGPDARYLGPLRQVELAKLVGQSACALITPLWDEPFGLVIAESLMTGTPVATFGVGGIPEVVAGISGAIAVAAEDVEALAEAVTALIARRSGDRSRQEVRQVAVQRFSIETRVRRLINLYLAQIDEFNSVGSVR